MNLMLANILGGVGRGVGAAGENVRDAREKAEDRGLRQQQIGFQERQIALAEQQAANERGDRETLAGAAAEIPELAPHAGVLRSKGGLDVIKMLVELNAKQKEKEREAAERSDLMRFITRSEGTPDTINRGGALDLGENPEAAGTSGLVPGQAPLGRTERKAGLSMFPKAPAALWDRLVPKEPDDKFMAAGPESDIINPRTGQVIRQGTPKVKEAQPGAEYVAAVGVLEQAEAAYRAKPTPQNKQAVALAATRVDRLKPMSFAYGGGIAGPSGQGPIVKPEAPPTSNETAQGIAASKAARSAAQAALDAVSDPEVQKYLGPYAQYKSEAQRRTPFQLAGEVPPAVIDLEQNTAKVKNYLIKLITGAAVRKDEEPRIIAEAVDLKYPPKEYAQRMQRTLEMITQYEQVVRDLALRGDQKALAVANEVGLLGGGNGRGGVNLSAPVNTGSAPPKAAPATNDPLGIRR